MGKTAILGNNNSSQTKARSKKFDSIYSRILKKRDALKKSSSKEKEFAILMLGYELLLLDADTNKSALSEYLVKKGYSKINGNRNPYLPIVNICFGDYNLNKNNKTKYGQALYYAAKKPLSAEKLNEGLFASVNTLAKNGAKLIRKTHPETDAKQTYEAGVELLEENNSMGKFKLTTAYKKNGGKWITLVAWLEKDKAQINIKHILSNDTTERLIKELGKEELAT